MDETGTTSSFNRASDHFDTLNNLIWSPISQATIDAINIASGNTVLDACCGTGASAIPAARCVGSSGRVDAIDLSPSMIERLHEASASLPQLHPHVADATTWEPDDYDVVLAVLGIFFFPQMDTATEHLVMRAKPQGTVAFTIWQQGAMVAVAKHLQDAVFKVTGKVVPERAKTPIESINTADAFGLWLERRNVTDVCVEVNEDMLPMSDDLAWLLVTGTGFVGALSSLSQDEIGYVKGQYLTSLHEAKMESFDISTLIGIGTRPAA